MKDNIKNKSKVINKIFITLFIAISILFAGFIYIKNINKSFITENEVQILSSDDKNIQTNNQDDNYTSIQDIEDEKILEKVSPEKDNSSRAKEEVDGLIMMREEEKLARDVYIKMYEIWGKNIFNNISQSENRHTEAVKFLLEKYNIEDPVQIDEKGKFKSQELQTLYDNLVARGSISLKDALQVGKDIEILDIKDLDNLLSKTDNQDIINVYLNLKKGSENHLNSFSKQLDTIK